MCLISCFATEQSSADSLPTLPRAWLVPIDSPNHSLEMWAQPGWSDMRPQQFPKCQVSPGAGHMRSVILYYGVMSPQVLNLPISCTEPGAMMIFQREQRFYSGECHSCNGGKCHFSVIQQIVISFYISAQCRAQRREQKDEYGCHAFEEFSKGRCDYVTGTNKFSVNTVD